MSNFPVGSEQLWFPFSADKWIIYQTKYGEELRHPCFTRGSIIAITTLLLFPSLWNEFTREKVGAFRSPAALSSNGVHDIEIC